MICFGSSNYLKDKKNFMISILSKIDKSNNVYLFSKKNLTFFLT
jgi:hypothetical protein